MGGNALSVNTKRLTKDEYSSFISFLLPKLSELVPNAKFSLIPSYNEKKTFGDVDIVVSDYGGVKNDLINAFKLLGSKEFKISRQMMFFELNSIQVDIMINDIGHLDFATCFYAYNDLSSLLIKKICSSKNFMLTTSGLYFDLKDNHNKYIGRILVTNEFDKVLRLFDFNVTSFRAGFNGLDEIFKFVTASIYFTPGKFNPEHFKKIDRASYAKRPVFKYFVDKVNSTECSPLRHDKAFLKKALGQLPEFSIRLNEKQKYERDRLLSKELFNGEIVSGLTGLSGSELGLLMSAIRKTSINAKNEYSYFIELGVENISKLIIEEFEKVKKSI